MATTGMVSGVGMLPQGLPTAKRPRVALDEVALQDHHRSWRHFAFFLLKRWKTNRNIFKWMLYNCILWELTEHSFRHQYKYQYLKVGSESAESGEGVEGEIWVHNLLLVQLLYLLVYVQVCMYLITGDCPMDEEIDLDSLKSYSSPDVLICGNCRFVF